VELCSFASLEACSLAAHFYSSFLFYFLRARIWWPAFGMDDDFVMSSGTFEATIFFDGSLGRFGGEASKVDAD
jgi:hypothetical protein